MPGGDPQSVQGRSRNERLLEDMIAAYLCERVYTVGEAVGGEEVLGAMHFGGGFTGSVSLEYKRLLQADARCSSVILVVLARITDCQLGREPIPNAEVIYYVFRGTINILHDVFADLQTKADYTALRAHGLFVQTTVWSEISNRAIFHQHDFISRLTDASAARLVLTGHSLGGAYANAALCKILVGAPSTVSARSDDQVASMLSGVVCTTFGAPTVFGPSEPGQPAPSQLQGRLRSRSTNYANSNDPFAKMYPGIDLGEFLRLATDYAVARAGQGDGWVRRTILGGIADWVGGAVVGDPAFPLVAGAAKQYQHICSPRQLGTARSPGSEARPADFDDHAIGAYRSNLRSYVELASIGIDPESLPSFQDQGLEDTFAKAMAEAGKKAHFTINIVGERGVGKTTLVNSLRGLNWGNKEHRKCGAGRTGSMGDTTMEPRAYHYNGLTLRDVPGCRGAQITVPMDDTYIDKYALDEGHACLLVYTRVVSLDSQQLARLLVARGAIVLLVRNQIDVDIANEIEENDGASEKEVLENIRQHTYDNQLEGLPGFKNRTKLFLVSSKYEHAVAAPKHDFKELLSAIWEELKSELGKKQLQCIMTRRMGELASLRASEARESIKSAAFACACVAAVPVPGLSTLGWYFTFRRCAQHLLRPFCLTADDLVSPAGDEETQTHGSWPAEMIAGALASHVPTLLITAFAGDVACDMTLPWFLGPLALPVGVVLDFGGVGTACWLSLHDTVSKLERVAVQCYELKAGRASERCVARMIKDLFPNNIQQAFSAVPALQAQISSFTSLVQHRCDEQTQHIADLDALIHDIEAPLQNASERHDEQERRAASSHRQLEETQQSLEEQQLVASEQVAEIARQSQEITETSAALQSVPFQSG